ncbi:DoxX family membrane protein [Paenibacillus sp. P25]|nr:DoxX family membrane protein [Paenibacillus sp. P25]
MGNFLHDVALPNVHVFNFLVPWGEFLIGLALILGLATIFAAFMGAIMNFSFFLSGSISIIPQMLMVRSLFCMPEAIRAASDWARCCGLI